MFRFVTGAELEMYERQLLALLSESGMGAPGSPAQEGEWDSAGTWPYFAEGSARKKAVGKPDPLHGRGSAAEPDFGQEAVLQQERARQWAQAPEMIEAQTPIQEALQAQMREMMREQVLTAKSEAAWAAGEPDSVEEHKTLEETVGEILRLAKNGDGEFAGEKGSAARHFFAAAEDGEAPGRLMMQRTGTAAGSEDMQKISDFFRRDSRRYDGGFKRY